MRFLILRLLCIDFLSSKAYANSAVKSMYIRGLLETKISLLLRIILPTVFMKGSIRSADHFLAEMTDMKLAAYKQFSPIYKFYNIVTYASSVAKNL